MELSTPIRILMIEGSDIDAAAVEAQLNACGLSFQLSPVENPLGLRDLMADLRWDLLLTDASQPNEDALCVFEAVQTLAPGMPWIRVSKQPDADGPAGSPAPDTRQGVSRSSLANLATAITAIQGEVRDGTALPAEGSQVAPAEGETRQATGAACDSRELMDQEREHFEYIQFLRTLIETLPNPLYYEDMGGWIQGCNGAFEKFLSLPKNSAIGQRTVDLFLGAVDDGSEDLEPGFLVYPDACETSFHMPLPDGRIHHAIFRKAPFWNADGRPEGYVVTLLDITKLKETEEALRQSESLFSAIHRHVIDLIAIIDESGHRIYTSPSYEFVLGYSQEEMAGLSSLDLLHPDDAERVLKALNGIMEGRPTQGLEYRLRHRDGRWLHFESRAAIMQDPGATSTRALVVARDVTERKEAEQHRSAMEVQLRSCNKIN